MSIEADFAEYYKNVDSYSLRWQRIFLGTERAQLSLLILAAVAGVVGSEARAIVVVAFIGATFAHLSRFVLKADEKWWNGRAGAESSKTLCWRYVVGGAPFALAELNSDQLLSDRLTEISKKVANFAPVAVAAGHISPAMRGARLSPLSERVERYRVERISEQMKWYARKSKFNATRGLFWAWSAIGCQATGLALAVVGLVNDWSLDFIGIFTALAASAAAWAAVKQHDVLMRAYAVASNELAAIETEISARVWVDEDSWAVYVDNAEEAISREHTSWRASRAV